MDKKEEVIGKLRQLKKVNTLHDLSTKLDVQQTTLWRWIHSGNINPKMAEWLDNKIQNKVT